MSIAPMAGVGPRIKIGGHDLEIRPKILRHYAEIEAEIVRRRGNPFDLIRQATEALKSAPEIIDQFVARAFDEAKKWRNVSLGEVGEFLSDTWTGQCYAIWLAVRDNDLDMWTFDNFSVVFSDEYEHIVRHQGEKAAAEWVGQIEKAIDQAGGEDELGNSHGSPDSSPKEEETPTQ